MPTYADGPETNRVAGIVYPSLRLRGDADNLALFPEFVHSSTALRQVQYVLVVKADYSRLAFSFHTLAIADEFTDGMSVNWRDDCRQRRRGVVTSP
jgi:hypothetical protein